MCVCMCACVVYSRVCQALCIVVRCAPPSQAERVHRMRSGPRIISDDQPRLPSADQMATRSARAATVE